MHLINSLSLRCLTYSTMAIAYPWPLHISNLYILCIHLQYDRGTFTRYNIQLSTTDNIVVDSSIMN